MAILFSIICNNAVFTIGVVILGRLRVTFRLIYSIYLISLPHVYYHSSGPRL